MSKAKQTAGKTAQTGAATRKGNTNKGNGREIRKGVELTDEAYATLEKIAAALNGLSWAEHDNTPLTIYKNFKLENRNMNAWARSIVLTIDTGAGDDLAKVKERREELARAFVDAGLQAEAGVYIPYPPTLDDLVKVAKAYNANIHLPRAAAKDLPLLITPSSAGLADAWERTPNTRKSVFWMNADTLERLDEIAKDGVAKSRADALKTIIKKLTGATVKVSFDSDSNRIGAAAETPHPDCALFGIISGEAGIIFGEGWRRFRAMGLKLKMDADALVKYLVEEGYRRWTPADPTM